MNIKLVHLFPEKMNIYGDWGNIEVLKRRIEYRDIGFEYMPVNTSSEFTRFHDGDIFFFGGGQDADQMEVWNEIKSDIDVFKSLIKTAFDAGKVFLLICGGYQMFGHSFIDSMGREIPGLSIIDIVTKSAGPNVSNRCIGNIAIETDLPISPKTLVGFENHGGQTSFLNSGELPGVKPLGKVLFGHGNNLIDGDEGCIVKNLFGSYLHGSLLPKNPHFADYLIKLALQNKYGGDISLTKLDDAIELKAHSQIIRRLGLTNML